MTIKQTVLGALEPILANTWAIELPPQPTWPAMVFEVATEEEPGWVAGGGYEQHAVTVVILARDLEQIEGTLKPAVKGAMEALVGYMGLDEEGDSGYEGDPEVYGYFLTFRIRTPKF